MSIIAGIKTEGEPIHTGAIPASTDVSPGETTAPGQVPGEKGRSIFGQFDPCRGCETIVKTGKCDAPNCEVYSKKIATGG